MKRIVSLLLAALLLAAMLAGCAKAPETTPDQGAEDTAGMYACDDGRAAWSYRQMDFGLSDPRMDAVRPALLRYL